VSTVTAGMKIVSTTYGIASADIKITSADIKIASAGCKIVSADMKIASAGCKIVSATYGIVSADIKITSAGCKIVSASSRINLPLKKKSAEFHNRNSADNLKQIRIIISTHQNSNFNVAPTCVGLPCCP